MRQTLVIADNDELFVENLEEYIMRNYSGEFEIRTCTDKKYLENFFSTPQNVDILLLNPSFEFKSLKDQYIKNILLIKDYEDDNSEVNYIFRYGEISTIYNKLKNLGTNMATPNDHKTDRFILDKAKIISVYSPIGGCGKSTISIAIALELSSQGNKVLYLNLEDTPTTNSYFKMSANNKNLSDIIVYLGAGSDSLKNCIQECINLDSDTKVSYINPVDNIFDLEEMSCDDIKYLIQVLREMNRFTHIIVDTSSTYNTFKKAIIDSSDKVISPIEQSGVCKEKIINFLKHIDEEELYKFIPIVNKYREEAKDCIVDVIMDNPSFQIQGSISFYEPLQNTDSYMEIFTKYNPFIASIKSIINY